MQNGQHVRLAVLAKCTPDVLLRCVNSAAHMIDSICIIIGPKAFDVLPRQGLGFETLVVQSPWKGIAPMRTLAYENAGADPKVDWLLMIDAEDCFTKSSALPTLDPCVESYRIPVEKCGADWRWRWKQDGHLLRTRRAFTWTGVGPNHDRDLLKIPPLTATASWDGLTITNFAESLKGLEAEQEAKLKAAEAATRSETHALGVVRPGAVLDTRTAFYYAQSLKDAGQFEEAFTAFIHRSRMAGGDPEETFWSKMWCGKLAREVHEDPIRFFLEAHQHSPQRAEPLHALAALYRWESDYARSYDYAAQARACPYPTKAQLLVEVHTYSESALTAAGIDL